MRRFVINRLICYCELSFHELTRLFDITAQQHFRSELAQLQPMAEDGLIQIDDNGIKVLNKGRLLIRRICMVFDEYLQQTDNNKTIRYSKII